MVLAANERDVLELRVRERCVDIRGRRVRVQPLQHRGAGDHLRVREPGDLELRRREVGVLVIDAELEEHLVRSVRRLTERDRGELVLRHDKLEHAQRRREIDGAFERAFERMKRRDPIELVEQRRGIGRALCGGLPPALMLGLLLRDHHFLDVRIAELALLELDHDRVAIVGKPIENS